MANRWGNMETVADFIFLGSTITADGDCSNEIKKRLLLMNNPDSIFKSRDITLPTKVHLVKAIVFPVVMYGCESWNVKKAEHQWIDAFELLCWRLLRVPWTARRSNQSILKEISPEYSLEGQLNIQKTKIMASGPITSRQVDGETVETVADFIFGGSKITADGDCGHEIKDTYSLEGKLWPT